MTANLQAADVPGAQAAAAHGEADLDEAGFSSFAGCVRTFVLTEAVEASIKTGVHTFVLLHAS